MHLLGCVRPRAQEREKRRGLWSISARSGFRTFHQFKRQDLPEVGHFAARSKSFHTRSASVAAQACASQPRS